MSLLFKGDLHLRLRAWESMPDVERDSFRAVEEIAAMAVARPGEISALILAGDNFDTNHPEPDEVEIFTRMVRLLTKHKVKVIFIQGQHCRGKRQPWPCIIPEPIHLHDKVIEVEPGLFMAGFDNMPGDELKDRLDKLDKKVDILVLHQMARGSLPEIEGKQNWDFDPDWVPKTVKLVILGDNHKDWETTRGDTRMLYTGSSCMQSIDEPPGKYVLRLNTPTLTIDKLPLQTRPFVTLLILDESAVAPALDTIKDLGVGTLVVVRYDARVTQVQERMMQVNKTVNYMWKILPLDVIQDEQQLTERVNPTLESCVSDVVSPETDPEKYYFLLELLRSPDTKETLAARKLKAMGEPAAEPPIFEESSADATCGLRSSDTGVHTADAGAVSGQ